MSNRRKLLIAFLLILGCLFMIETFVENIDIFMPIGLAILLYGMFWMLGAE
jgi:hypothetical protein